MASRLYDRLYAQAQVELAKILQGEERSIIRLYGTALYDIRKILKDLYDKYSVEGKLTNGEMSKYNRLANVQDQIEKILEKNLKQVDSLTKRLTAEQYSEAFYRHAYAIDQVGGMALNWGLIPEEAVEAAMKSPFSKLSSSKALKASREGTVDRIRQEIGLSVIRGDSYDVLANRISAVLGVSPKGTGAAFNGKGAAYRSLLVARTEGQRILVEGQEAATKKALDLGCDIETIWDATLDSRTRPAHAALDGRPKDDPEKGWYVPEIGYVTAPLHSGVAAFDINCRCRTRDQVRGFPPDERYVRGDGIKPYQTYDQWKQEIIEREKSRNIDLSGGNGIFKADNKAVREWYVSSIERIHDSIDQSLPMEEKARQAFEIRNRIKTEARNMMKDQNLRASLDASDTKSSFEKLVVSKMERKGMTRAEAIEDVYNTAVKSNKDVNKELGISDVNEN